MHGAPARQSSDSSSLEHASQLMATSSGTEVGAEMEEEVEYVEEVVEYEEEEVEEVEEDERKEEQQEEEEKQSETAAAAPPAAQAEEQSSAASAADEGGSSELSGIPPSTSAQDLSVEPNHAQQPSADAAEDAAQSSEPKVGHEATTVGGGAGVDLDFKQLEAQAAKVAKEMSQVALDVSSKLTAGLRSAFGAPDGSSASASSGPAASLSKLAGGLSSWWGSLDPAPQPARDETAERVAASNKASSELQALFGLSPEENLVEHFKCKLLQTYSCNHNPHTPAIQMAFQGTLYVTDKHTCFSVEERGRKVPFKVPHNLVVRATRQRPARKGDLSDVLKIELSNGQWLAFKDFDSGSSLDSALALVEHLTEGS